MNSSLATARLQLGHAILSPTRAAELLPVREADALRWLREHALVRTVPGLGDVVASKKQPKRPTPVGSLNVW